MQAFLQAQAPKIAAQVAAARAKFRKLAKDQTTAATLAIDETGLSLEDLAWINGNILNELDFSEWTTLVADAEPILEQIVNSQGLAALAQVGIDVEARPEVMNIVNERAVEYAQARAAELVGMRRDALGNLVANPNAQWQITDSTREMIRADVTKAIEEGWSNDKLAKALKDAYGFSGDRATMIARTETSIAQKAGAMEGYRASGVVESKQWLTAEDDLVEEDCQENADAGVIALEDDFPNGDFPHPNCRCSIAPVVDFDMPTTH